MVFSPQLAFSGLLLWASCTIAINFTIPQGNGPYSVYLTHSELVDDNRRDPWNHFLDDKRRLMVSRFDPVPKNKCEETVKSPYMSDFVGILEDNPISEFGIPRELIPFHSRFQLETCSEEAFQYRIEAPLVLFSPAISKPRMRYSALAQEIASFGFSVIMVDHPYETHIVEFPSDDNIRGGASVRSNSDDSLLLKAIEVRVADLSFILDHEGVTLNSTSRPLVFGHAIGRATAATAMFQDKRFRAGVNIDGRILGPAVQGELGTKEHPQAFLFVGTEGTNTINTDVSDDRTWVEFWEGLMRSKDVDWMAEFSIINATHTSFDDTGLVVDIAGIRDEFSPLAQHLTFGLIPGAEMRKILGLYLSTYFNRALHWDEDDSIFRDAFVKFPEVLIVRTPF